jgi:hypothetical protein
MSKAPSELEMKLARERKARLTAEFKRTRNISCLWALAFAALAVFLSFIPQPMLAFNAGVISLIFVVRAFDAHGMIEDVQRRSDKTLYVRMSSIEHGLPGKTVTDVGGTS